MGCGQSKEHVQIPWELSSLSNHEWLEWKKCFLTFINHKYIPPYKQSNKFIKYTGYLGEEIANKLYFYNSIEELELKKLIFKFDVYFIYGGISKQNQNFDEYIAYLENIAMLSGNKNNVQDIVKEKILQDFKSFHIFEQLKNMPYSSSISDYEKLSLDELKFLWNECERSLDKHLYMVDLENNKNSPKSVQARKDCIYCGRKHESKKCPSYGKECWKCEKTNHFARCCPKIYITGCVYCGSSHVENKCPAFGKECSKCKRMNHFAWKCFKEIISSCIFCGTSHLEGRQNCLAKDFRCSNCQKMGHFSSKCFSHRNKRYR